MTRWKSWKSIQWRISGILGKEFERGVSIVCVNEERERKRGVSRGEIEDRWKRGVCNVMLSV